MVSTSISASCYTIDVGLCILVITNKITISMAATVFSSSINSGHLVDAMCRFVLWIWRTVDSSGQTLSTTRPSVGTTTTGSPTSSTPSTASTQFVQPTTRITTYQTIPSNGGGGEGLWPPSVISPNYRKRQGPMCARACVRASAVSLVTRPADHMRCKRLVSFL